MNPNIPNIWNVWNSPNVDARIYPPVPPQPLMSLPLTTPPIQIFHPPFAVGNNNGLVSPMFSPSLSDSGLSPSYAGIISPIFTQQVPATCLPNLRFPPPTPPYRGQPIWNPYIIPSFTPDFGYMFDSMLDENLNRAEQEGQLADAVNQFRSLSLNDQLEQFRYSRTLSVEQVQIRWQLVLDLLFILRQEFPMCQIHPFGSVISGLGDMSSDIDIYVDLFGSYVNANTPPLSPADTLQEARRALNKVKCPHTACFFNKGPVISIPQARVPVLKMKHSTSSLSYDLTFSNRFAVQNSKLITFYTNFDPRVFRFMILIRYWFKYHHISGSTEIKNYALCLLGLVYLMQEEIIPSVFLLQKLKETQRREQGIVQNPDEINEWDASFCEDFEFINQNFERTPIPPDFNENPTEHLLKLAMEFFKMCANTNFSSVVVCPFLGDIILKGGFIPGNEVFLTDMLHRYKTFTFEKSHSERLKLKTHMCIQDPFELNVNVTDVAPFATVIKFQIACAKTAEVLSEKFNNENSKSNEALSVMDLFIPLPSHLRNKELLKAIRKDLIKKKTRKEILLSLGLTDNHEEDEERKQKNKYTKLPRHLAQLDELVDPNTVQAWQKENSPNELASVFLHQQFSNIFFDEVAMCRLLANENERGGKERRDLETLKLNLTKKVTSLWRKFATDFIEKFFNQALKLNMEDKKVLEASTPIGGLNPEDLNGLELSGQGWKINVPLKGIERSKGRKEEFRKRVSKIKDISDEEAGYYRKLRIQVSYPFWSERAVVLKEWKNNEKKTVTKSGKAVYHKVNPIEVEAEISDDALKKWQAKRKGSQGTGNVSNTNDVDDDVQIVEEHPQANKKRPRMENDNFKPFQMDILVKISSKVASNLEGLRRPTMTLIFQNGTKGYIFKNAASKLNSIVQSVFPEYQEYRLLEWLSKGGKEEKNENSKEKGTNK